MNEPAIFNRATPAPKPQPQHPFFDLCDSVRAMAKIIANQNRAIAKLKDEVSSLRGQAAALQSQHAALVQAICAKTGSI